MRLFELGSIYLPKSLPVQELPNEELKVTMGMYGNVDFYDLKGVTEELLYTLGIQNYEVVPCTDNPSFHPGRTATLLMNGQEFGIIGEIHPTVLENYEMDTKAYVGILDFDILLKNYKEVSKYTPLPKYPAVTRDIAMLVKDEILVKQIEDIIKKCSGKLLEDIQLFDVYKGKQIPQGLKSVAYSITYRANDRTLTDEDINKVFDKMLKQLKTNLDAQLRE